MSSPSKVVVAMSGGVDSSVAAALLVEQGYQVIGMMLRLWSPPGSEEFNRCCTPEAMDRARRVAALLDIPFYAVDARQPFHDTVVQYFLDGYLSGVTPNPCLACNRHIRWDLLLNQALTLGAEFMATGHYAIIRHHDSQPSRLYRAVDASKDQSYVLSVLEQEQLQHALFPLGEYTKQEVRQLAERFDLPVSSIKDSQDLCFLGDSTYSDFIELHAPESVHPGPIKSISGEILGQHRGLSFYTIGQRKGLGLASPSPLYVSEKDTAENSLIVGTREQMGTSELVTSPINWLDGFPPTAPFSALLKISYTSDFFPPDVDL
ncbi:MAG: tRNA 2-thiouridine(34) synthase MnmA, partial [Anaerolineae bacterium]|nr:tRNA 2-thiouridine(34) synthase MnmA [Anaerolineae bacterium]